MCSIDGFTGEQPFTIEQYGSLNADRGPDGTNHFTSPEISIAHSLLAIQSNPTNLQQPVVNERTGNVLAYNGELFDCPGFDTEKVMDIMDTGAHGELADHTNGMFAIAYYNRAERELILIRDHFGVKPLYYMELAGDLFFASTPKPLLATLNAKQFKIHENSYGTLIWENNDRFIFGKRTPLQHIKRLAPGEMRVWDLERHRWKLDMNILQTRKWSMQPNFSYNDDEFKEQAVNSITSVCTAPGIEKTISLSGGLDSTLIAGVCASQGIEVSATTTSFRKNATPHETVNELSLIHI